MSKLQKEAMGQYNYVAPTPNPEKGGRKRHSYPDFYPHTDVTVEIVNPEKSLFSNLKPPKMFDTSYFSDYQHPPAQNFLPYKKQAHQGDYTAYVQAPQTKTKRQREKHQEKANKSASAKVASESNQKLDRSFVRSAGEAGARVPLSSKQPKHVAHRVKSAEPDHHLTESDRINEEFYRSLLKARSGSEWKRKPDVSYDVLNPDKPSLERETKPYGSHMENVQERISQSRGEKIRSQRPATGGEGSKTIIETAKPPPVRTPPRVKRIGPPSIQSSPSVSRASTSSGRSRKVYSRLFDTDVERPASSSSISTLGGDYLLETGRHANETLETIQEEEIVDDFAPRSPVSPKLKTFERRRSKPKIKKPQPPKDLFTKKGPDPRFYASKKNLRTPNEMERFRKARARAYMRNVEQAIPELDFTDHEVKYQPERQLFRDVRWKIRKDVKDVRDKNTNSLIDRFDKRRQVIHDETRTRLGDPTYIGRNPVSIYKLNESTSGPNVDFKVNYPLHARRRVTPSLGSVQRARNLGSHAQIFNQPIAPPYWGPQKVDHSVFLPAMAQKI